VTQAQTRITAERIFLSSQYLRDICSLTWLQCSADILLAPFGKITFLKGLGRGTGIKVTGRTILSCGHPYSRDINFNSIDDVRLGAHTFPRSLSFRRICRLAAFGSAADNQNLLCEFGNKVCCQALVSGVSP
jgi:hypothetical protein